MILFPVDDTFLIFLHRILQKLANKNEIWLILNWI